jgi:hypothetical protein
MKSDFENAQDKPKFHMGMRLGARANKNIDQPGPGEYEVDVPPTSMGNTAHVIGTSMRAGM